MTGKRLSLTEEVRLLALEVLEGGWWKYGYLTDDRTQIRCTWHSEGADTWLQVENLETGHEAMFTLDVTVQPFTPPPVGPEDDGALRAELAEEATAKPVMHYWPGDSRAFGCNTDSGLRTSSPDSVTCGKCIYNLKAPTECLNCAPLAAGASASRVDGTKPAEPCEDCRERYPCTWAEVRAGDQVQGEDGSWYPVRESKPSSLFNGTNPIQVVTLEIGGVMRAYDMPYHGPVRIKLGEEHRAIRNLKAGFPGTEEVR